MREGIVVADLADPSEVYGVHGSEGLSRWKCLARRAGLFGSWEAVEWAWIPVGGVSGEHLHTRTEEIYFLLTGRGEISLNGRPHQVQAGDLILTGLGTRHGLRNTGTEGLGWLVIEMTSPATATALHRAHPHPSDCGTEEIRSAEMSNSTVIDLRATRRVDPSPWLTGPIRVIQLVTLAPNDQAEIAADGTEHTLFTLHGRGVVNRADISVPLGPNVAVTLPLGTHATVVAGPEGLEYFQASLDVPTPHLAAAHNDRHGGDQ